jgi:hypothetical protein
MDHATFVVQNSNQSKKINLMKLKLRVQSGYMHKSEQKLKACCDSYTQPSAHQAAPWMLHTKHRLIDAICL